MIHCSRRRLFSRFHVVKAERVRVGDWARSGAMECEARKRWKLSALRASWRLENLVGMRGVSIPRVLAREAAYFSKMDPGVPPIICSFFMVVRDAKIEGKALLGMGEVPHICYLMIKSREHL